MPGPFDSVHDEPSPVSQPPRRRLPPGSVIEHGKPRHPPEEAKPATRTRRKAQPAVQAEPQGSAQG